MGHNKHVDLFKDMIPAIDLGIKELWDASTDEGRKEIAGDLWNLNRYISSVKTNNRELQEYYVLAVNEYYNKNWFLLSKHPKLQWMLLCLCSYDNKSTFFHEWIGLNHKNKNKNNKKINLLAKLYPLKKMDDIELLATLYTDKELYNLAKDFGIEDNEFNKIFK